MPDNRCIQARDIDDQHRDDDLADSRGGEFADQWSTDQRGTDHWGTAHGNASAAALDRAMQLIRQTTASVGISDPLAGLPKHVVPQGDLPDPTGILARLGINRPQSGPTVPAQPPAPHHGIKSRLSTLLKKLPAMAGALPDGLPSGLSGLGLPGLGGQPNPAAAEAAAAAGGEIRGSRTPSRPEPATIDLYIPTGYTGAAGPAGGHAARRHPGRRRLRGRHRHERPRRAAHLPGRLPRAVPPGQPERLLELVPPGGSAGRAGEPAIIAGITRQVMRRARRRPRPGVRGRALRRRRDGRGDGRDLPRSVRRRRRALRPRLPRGPGHSVGLRRDAHGGEPVASGSRAADRLPRRRRYRRRADQRREAHRQQRCRRRRCRRRPGRQPASTGEDGSRRYTREVHVHPRGVVVAE